MASIVNLPPHPLASAKTIPKPSTTAPMPVPEHLGPKFSQATIKFVQDGNTLGTTEEFEELFVQIETQLPGEDAFFVLRTSGWSMDSVAEFEEIMGQAWRAKDALLNSSDPNREH